ncbi:MAG: MIP/aquaporin family protein [Planctomycetia bacterium]|nr:MIP/aquaporin family protein [Planctomycetia bacterium]
MQKCIAEFVGTMFLIIFGCGVCANATLVKSKGFNAGFGTVVMGWAVGVALAVFMFRLVSGAHFNPALTVAFAFHEIGGTTWADVPGYLIAQFAGAFCGAIIVILTYFKHFQETDDLQGKLGVFCTFPAIRNGFCNFMTEFIGTFVLAFVCMGLSPYSGKIGDGFAAFTIGMLILAIGYSLGGPTGFAINPVRDLGPRIAHFLMPIGKKRDSDWGYAWIPIVAPILGGIAGVEVWLLIFKDFKL